MPSLIRYANGIFYIVSTINRKRVWRSLHTKNRREAYERYLELQPKTSDPAQLGLLEAQKQYLNYVKTNFSPTTFQIYQGIFKCFNSSIGTKSCAEITPTDIEQYKAVRLESVSATTVNHHLRGLKAFFGKLVAWNLLQKNPCNGVKSIRVADTIRAYLTKQDLAKLLDHTRGTQLHVEGHEYSPPKATSFPQGGPLAFPTQGHKLSPG